MKLTVINSQSNKFGITIPDKKRYNAKDILRIQSQLISNFIQGKIDGSDAKVLSYLCSNFIQNLSVVEVETRLKNLEERM